MRTAQAVLQQLEPLLLELYLVKQRVLLEQHARAISAQAMHTARAVLQQLERVPLKLYCPSSTVPSRTCNPASSATAVIVVVILADCCVVCGRPL